MRGSITSTCSVAPIADECSARSVIRPFTGVALSGDSPTAGGADRGMQTGGAAAIAGGAGVTSVRTTLSAATAAASRTAARARGRRTRPGPLPPPRNPTLPLHPIQPSAPTRADNRVAPCARNVNPLVTGRPSQPQGPLGSRSPPSARGVCAGGFPDAREVHAHVPDQDPLDPFRDRQRRKTVHERSALLELLVGQ